MNDLAAALSRRVDARNDEPTWRPEIYAPQRAVDRTALLQLLERPEVLVFDTLLEQIDELIETRSVGHKLSATDRRAATLAHLAGQAPEDYGNWVHYPWSRRLVHVLPAPEFAELRASRNRNKITAAQQQRLRELDICVIGLSVGRASAIVLAQEGIGGRLRLADFDRLELSNLNRIREGVHGLGVNKAVLTAREIAEIDPYLEVHVIIEGATVDNLDTILLGQGRVDLVIEECDDLEMKVRIRERARALGIPVVMETSDRGMVDIERFDLEPARPLFHGAVGQLSADRVAGLSTYDKVPYVLAILGANGISDALAASLIDVDTTLKTWPQLASAVALGAAVNAEVARRIALGQLGDSGRCYVDFDRLLLPCDPPGAQMASVAGEGFSPTYHGPPQRDAPIRAWMAWLVEQAALAPSGGNCQPWRFRVAGRSVQCELDPTQPDNLLNFEQRGSLLACGAAAANLTLAAQATGWRCDVTWQPDGPNTPPMWRAQIEPGDQPTKPELWRAVQQRCTNRRVTASAPLSDTEAKALGDTVKECGAELMLLRDPGELAIVAELLAEGDRFRMLHRRLHAELFAELRWTPTEARNDAMGIDIATLELDPTQRAALEVARRWSVMELLACNDAGQGLGRGTRKAVATSAGVGLVRMSAVGPAAFLKGGWAVEHLWLRAEGLGLCVQPVTALLYLIARARDPNGGFDPSERTVLLELDEQLAGLGRPSGGSDIMLLRLSRSPPPTRRALRRQLDTILVFDDD